ncbi:hypothetical protein FRACYDRAFT_260315 [Fragilariopsis cylindrus CCMP1102]|uniref:Uncharacterized protein n=1 Tax=Fragilariopsis cylindrus CCMP1102 TaxID=635003 RepID=A0A1E7FJ74_9STRA|nr:hypothetical protein FRACYDRAFT_260315 [Fragilariopsis cylindrus CCMP1102]|eukprot:OEU18220.1 hypothetical protein FRACYDRAFT_260315 [Fragilariopsis cylindrus CCMP1102]
MTSLQMNTFIAANASILEKTNYEKIESTYNTCIVHKRQQQREQYQPPRRLEDKNALPVSLRFLPTSYFRNRNSLSTTIAADLGVLHKNHTSLDQLLEHFDRSCEMMSSEDQEQEEDATVTASTTSFPIASSLSSSIMTSTTFDSTSTASTARSSLKRKIRIVNDDSHNEIVSTSTQRRCDDNYQRSNNSPKRMKRMKYARRNSVVIRDIQQLSQIATDLSTIS